MAEGGKICGARLAHVEAIAHLERGLALLAGLPETPARDACEIELQLALGVSSITVKGMGSPEIAAAYGRARDLCEKGGDASNLFTALWGLWLSHQNRRCFETAAAISNQLLDLNRSGDIGRRLQAHHTAWTTHFYSGQPALCRQHSAEGRRLYDLERDRSHALRYGGHDPGVCACNMAGFAEWLLGYPDTALASSVEALAIAERLAHPFSLNIAHFWAAVLHQFRREPEASLRRLDAAEAVAVEHRLAWIFNPRVLRGGALAAEGAVEEGVLALRAGLDEAWDNQLMRPYGLTLLAGALAKAGDNDSALAAIDEGLTCLGQSNERWWEAELHRVKGELLLRRSEELAQPCFTQSLHVARQQQARSLELRAATSLAGYGTSRAGGPTPAICWRRSTAGSPRGSTPPI